MELSVTLVIIIITTIISLSALQNQRVMDKMMFYPPYINRGQWYRFFSSGLIHADFGHLIFNMLGLYLFGMGQQKSGVEYQFIDIFGPNGKWIYLLMYVLALGACLIPTYAKNKDNYHYRSLGASGGVSAVIFTAILLRPTGYMGLFILPVYIYSFIFGLLFLFISSLLDRRGGDNINHSAHIFGALFGVAFLVIAARVVDYPVVTLFIEMIRQADWSDAIIAGREAFNLELQYVSC